MEQPKKRRRVNWDKSMKPDGKSSNDVLLEWFKVPGNFRRALVSSSIARKLGIASENDDKVGHEVLQRLHAEGFTFRKYAKVFLKLCEWIVGYIKARALATRENNPNQHTIQRTFPFYYYLCDHIGDVDEVLVSVILGQQGPSHGRVTQQNLNHDDANDRYISDIARKYGGMVTSTGSCIDEQDRDSIVNDNTQIHRPAETLTKNGALNGQHEIAISYVRSRRSSPRIFYSSHTRHNRYRRLRSSTSTSSDQISHEPTSIPSPEPPSPEPPSPTPSSSSHDSSSTFRPSYLPSQPPQPSSSSTTTTATAIVPSNISHPLPSNHTVPMIRKRTPDRETNASIRTAQHLPRRIESLADDDEALEETNSNPLETMQRNNEQLRQSHTKDEYYQHLLHQQYMLLNQQARIYRIQEMQAQSTLINAMKDAGFSKDEIATALKEHGQSSTSQ